MTQVILPAPTIPISNEFGRINPIWYACLYNLRSVVSSSTALQPYSGLLTEISSNVTDGFLTYSSGHILARTFTGTTNRIDVNNGTGATTNPTIDISAFYTGQDSINTLGTIQKGNWASDIILPRFGGTGVDNGLSTFTIAGGYNFTATLVGDTNVTFPTSGTITAIIGSIGPNQVMITNGSSAAVWSNSLSSLVQSNITTLGIITSGSWQGSNISPVYGGTGQTNPTGTTLTWNQNVSFAGNFAVTMTATATVNITWPSGSGTLALTSDIPSTPISLANGGTAKNNTAPNTGTILRFDGAGYANSGAT